MLWYVLGRKDAAKQWIYERCKEVEETPNDCLDLWSREHYKLQRLDEPTPTPTGVTYRVGRGPLQTVNAREVILCGGAINSPQLLQVSGVGPAAGTGTGSGGGGS